MAELLQGPLTGVRVVELAGIGPGPFACMLLADMGADVIRVERPSGTPSAVPPELDVMRRSRSSIALDLRQPRGVEAVLEMIESADVLIEGFRPGVAERLGLGPNHCHGRNQRLVYGRMTGWGQRGPWAQTAGHDISYLAVTGALHAMGRKGERPAIPLNLVGDFGGGSLYLVVGILAALHHARTTGSGQVVDAAIVDGASSLTALLHGMMAARLWRDERGVNMLDSGVPWYDVYETADGRHMAVGALEPAFFAELMKVLDLDFGEAERADQGRWGEMRDRIAERFRTRTMDAWTDVFAPTDACVSPVLSLKEAASNPHLVARETFVEVGGVVQPAPAPRFSLTPSAVQRPPGAIGSNTREELTRWGVTEVDDLIADGVAVEG
jgi:alpha-methylacyl-CoA racemase